VHVRAIVVAVAVAALLGTGAAPAAVGATAASADPSRGCKARSLPPRTEVARSIDVDGVARSYRLRVPTGNRVRPMPLVLLVHGYAGNAARFSALTRMTELGARRGVIVAVPDGIDGRWMLDAHGADADFLDALVEHVERTHCVDRNRLHTVGNSLGSAFAILWSCARQDRVASIASVTVEFQLGCTGPMSIESFHGTSDPAVPYQDGAVGASLPGPVRGTEQNMADWASLAGCSAEPRQRRVGSDVVRRSWPGCRGTNEVVLYTVEGGGHTWPGADQTQQAGHTTDQVDAAAEILTFFRRHPLR
jgi:polyhydroxybutyrate depolymerase